MKFGEVEFNLRQTPLMRGERSLLRHSAHVTTLWLPSTWRARSDQAVWVWLADAIVVVHLAYLAFVPFGGVVTWRWPRVVWAHLTAVGNRCFEHHGRVRLSAHNLGAVVAS